MAAWRALAQQLARHASRSSSAQQQAGCSLLPAAALTSAWLGGGAGAVPSPSLLPSSPSPFAPAASSSMRAGMATNSHDVFNQHKDTAENHAETTFEWTPVSRGSLLGPV